MRGSVKSHARLIISQAGRNSRPRNQDIKLERHRKVAFCVPSWQAIILRYTQVNEFSRIKVCFMSMFFGVLGITIFIYPNYFGL